MRPVAMLLLAAAAISPAAFAQTQTTIGCGTLAGGSFTQGSFDAFNFTALAGDVILVRAALNSTDPAFVPRFILIDPANRPVTARPPNALTSAVSPGATFVGEYELLVEGPYQIRVQNDNPASTGSFVVSYTLLNRPCTQSLLRCGEGTSGQLTAQLQMNTFQFAATEGDVLSLRVTKSAPAVPGSSLVTYVYSPAGKLLTTPGGQAAAVGIAATGSGRVDFTSPVTGLLNIIMFDRSAAANTDNFAIGIFRLNGPCADNTLSCDSVQEGTIATALAVNSYSLALSAGEAVAIRTANLSTGAFVPFVEVSEPGSAPVALAASSLPGARGVSYAFTARVGGMFTVAVRDGSTARNNTGNYAISLVRITRPCNAAAIACGSVVDGTIAGPLRANVYRLQAAASDVFLLRMLHNDQNPSFRARVDVYDPRASLVESLTVSDLGRVTFRPAAEGVYTLVVADGFDSSQAGTYTLSLQRLNRPCDVRVLSCGGTAAGSFGRPLASSVFTHSAAAGESFTVRMTDLAGTLQPAIEVYDPQGDPVGARVGASYAGVDVAQPAGGTYTIIAADESRRPLSGLSRVGLLRTVNPCAPAPPQGQTTTGAVTVPAPFTAYTLPVTAGDGLLVRSASFTGGFSAQMELYDPAGQRLESQTFRIARTAAVSGNYTLIVGASGARTGGAYSFSWQLLNNPAGVLPLQCGATVAASLSAPGQFRYYSANAAAGDLLRLIFTRTADNFSPQVELYDPSGVRLAAGSDIGQRVASEGSYLVIVSPATATGETGSFALAYQRPNNPCDPVALTCGQTTLRQVDLPGQLDTFSFRGAAGSRMTLSLAQRSGGYAPFAELYDGAGTRLASSASGVLTANLAAEGGYSLLVRDRAGVGLGSYRVSLRNETSACPVDDKEAPAISLIQPTGGEVIVGAAPYLIQWQSDDNAGISTHALALSTDGGATFASPIAVGLSGNLQSYTWLVPAGMAPSRTAVIRVTATDSAGNSQSALSGPLSIIGSGFTPNSTTTLSYDSQNRLTRAVMGDGRSIEYTWDAAGNLLEVRVVAP